jgi:uncharacterized protein YlzI (FlbEa/FlbD family)
MFLTLTKRSNSTEIIINTNHIIYFIMDNNGDTYIQLSNGEFCTVKEKPNGILACMPST